VKRSEAKDNQWLVVADYADQCGEGPLWDSTTSTLYWFDITGRRAYRYDWARGQSSTMAEDFDIAGLALHESGGFVLVNGGGIWLWDGRAAPTSIARELDGLPLAMNDCIADPRGRLLSGTCHFDPEKPDYPLGKLIRVDTDGTVSVLDDGFHLANGLAFSPDSKTFYFADSAARKIFAYDYNVEEGTAGNRRTLIEVPREQGLPDGITVDSEGFIWFARWFGAGLTRLDPDGHLHSHVEVPAKQTSSLAFGGPDLTSIFVTSAALSDSVALAPPGYDPDAGNIGGQLFRWDSDIQGKEEFRCRIAVPAG